MAALGGRMYIFGGDVAAEYKADLHAFILPRRVPWPSVESFAVEAASLYDWDTLLLGESNAMPGGDEYLCHNVWPCHLSIVGPGTISASSPFSFSCRDSEGCTGMEFSSVSITGDDGFSLFLAGARLHVSNSALSGARVTVGAAALNVASSTLVNSSFVLERAARLSMHRANFSGSASSARPALFLYSGTTASIESCKFEHLRSTWSGAALLVVGSQLDVIDSTFTNCFSGESGGAIHGETLFSTEGETPTRITISSSVLSECEAASAGGGISAKGSAATIHVHP
jgi:hypothetical protein